MVDSSLHSQWSSVLPEEVGYLATLILESHQCGERGIVVQCTLTTNISGVLLLQAESEPTSDCL